MDKKNLGIQRFYRIILCFQQLTGVERAIFLKFLWIFLHSAIALNKKQINKKFLQDIFKKMEGRVKNDRELKISPTQKTNLKLNKDKLLINK